MNEKETTSHSMKFAPVPIAALLANLDNSPQSTPDDSFKTDDSDSSFNDLVEKKPAHLAKADRSTPQYRISKNIKSFASERKVTTSNKENESFQNRLIKETQSARKPSIEDLHLKNDFSSDKPVVLKPLNTNTKILQSKPSSAHKKTPEPVKVPTSAKKKIATPVLKSGIRRFTPGSAKCSNKKTPQHPTQSREKVRCELFRPAGIPAPSVPDTPINKKPIPACYVATPSHPQNMLAGASGNPSKKLFKITAIKDKKYMLIKKLGIGGSSEVFKVLEVGTSTEYALKCVLLSKDDELAQGYINEVRLLKELQNSDRVIKMYDFEYDRQNQFLRMVLEVGETDLSSFLRARGAGLPPALVLHYWEEMLHAVNYIHQHGVIHADLKPANFLLVCGCLKLIDFGIASAISGDATSVVRAQAAGTYSYISPEALMGGAGGYHNSTNIKISFKSDVWSLGCILYSMVYGRTPFGHIPNLAKLAAILDPNHRIDYPPAPHLPATLIAALKWCLTYNARARPSVKQLLSLRYFPTAPEEWKPLPDDVLEKLKIHSTPEDYQLLLQSRIPVNK